ncbi:MAG: hypothetical protein R3F00_06050 [Dokdonella sp.]
MATEKSLGGGCQQMQPVATAIVCEAFDLPKYAGPHTAISFCRRNPHRAQKQIPALSFEAGKPQRLAFCVETEEYRWRIDKILRWHVLAVEYGTQCEQVRRIQRFACRH